MSVALLLPVFTANSLPPETVAVLVTLGTAVLPMATLIVIGVAVAPAASTAADVHVTV